MTDQCKHCDLRGDLKKCKSTDCFQHESWYAVEQQKVIEQLEAKIDAIVERHTRTTI